eukprot:290794-Rhodomonas_salina.3
MVVPNIVRMAPLAFVVAACCTFALSVSGATHAPVVSSQRSKDSTLADMGREPRPSESLLDSLQSLMVETVADRKGSQITDGLDQMHRELAALTRQSEELQATLLEHTTSERLMAKMSERESSKGDSLVLPLKTAAQTVVDEVVGGRRASSAPIHDRGNRQPADVPILVPHRRGRDDVLALKLLSLLEASAVALNDSAHVLDSAAGLQASNASYFPTEACDPEVIAAALFEDDAGIGRREVGAFASSLLAEKTSGTQPDVQARCTSLRGGCGAESEEASRVLRAGAGAGAGAGCAGAGGAGKRVLSGREGGSMALHRRRGQDGKRGWGLGGEHHGGRRMGRLRGGWEVKVDLTDIAERKRPQVSARRRAAEEESTRMETEGGEGWERQHRFRQGS